MTNHVFQRSTRAAMPMVVGGRGIELVAADGRRFIDACGGAAVSCLGHGHPVVAQAIARQAETLAYAHTSFFTNEPAEALADCLAAAAPASLSRAPRIFVAAFMSCRAPGLAFTYICRLFRSNVMLLGAEGTSLVADLADIRSEDAVLSINFVPYSRDIRLIAAAVERSGAALVSIADSRVTPLSQYAKSILLFGAESPSFFPSITSAVALVESVAAAMLAHAGDGAVSRVRAVEKALYSSGSYEDHA